MDVADDIGGSVARVLGEVQDMAKPALPQVHAMLAR